jgi:hypothetical protein
MATVTNTNGAVVAGNGLGSTTHIFAVTTGTTSMADAVALATNTYNMTVVGVSGTTGTSYLACQGGNVDAAGTGALEDDSGIALTVTFEQNPA